MTTESYCRTCKRRRPDTHFETHLDHERALPRNAVANATYHALRTTTRPAPRPAAVPLPVSTQDTWGEDEFEDGKNEIVEEIPTWKILAGLGAVGAFLVGVGVLAARVTPPPDVLARMNEARSSNIHNDTSSFPHGFSVR